jgi:hypothetical protein
MAYSTSNPPALWVNRIGGGPALWIYQHTDAIAAIVADADYFINAADLGMKENDLLAVVNTTNDLTSLGTVGAVHADGYATIVALTAVA